MSTADGFGKKYGLLLALLAMAAVYLLPTPADLPTEGHRLIGILVFAVIVWMTEGVSYPVSAFVIVTFMSFALGLAPNPAKPGAIIGTANALKMALSGFSSSAWALVAGAMFLSAAMMITGLDKRIALVVMSHIGVKSNRLVIGVIFVGFLLSFFVPSTTARVSCMVPIVIGIIRAFGLKMGSTFAGVLMMAVAQADSLWNIGIKTAAAQNMVAIGFIQQVLGEDISWLEWFIAAAPYAAIMSVILYFLLLHVMPPEIKEMPGGKEALDKMLHEMGPISVPEKKLLFISILLLCFWVTEKKLHPFDTTTVTIAGIMLMMLPRIGFMTWKEAVPHINWGTVALFGVGISLGSALLKSGAAIQSFRSSLWDGNHVSSDDHCGTGFLPHCDSSRLCQRYRIGSCYDSDRHCGAGKCENPWYQRVGHDYDSAVYHLLWLYPSGQCAAEYDRL